MVLWNSLNENTEIPYFTNPAVSSWKVPVFADVPHVMKMQNHFLDNEFVMKDEKVVQSSCAWDMVA